jgi:hypothetical protein
VQGIDTDDASSGACGGSGDRGKGREITDALVALAAKRIGMRGEAEAAGAGAKLARQETAIGRRNDTTVTAGILGAKRWRSECCA